MPLYSTYLRAIDPCDETLKTWSGITISAKNLTEAEAYLQANELGYLMISGEIKGIQSTERNEQIFVTESVIVTVKLN